MKKILITILLVALFKLVSGQTIIKMEKKNGIFVMPCSINGLGLKFVFDTGASDVSISLSEALFMLKNDYLLETDILGSENYRIADGEIKEGTRIVFRKITIGSIELNNVEASIVHNLNAPLLLGQSALSRLGKVEFDYSNNTITIDDSKVHNNPEINGVPYLFETTFDKNVTEGIIRNNPNPSAIKVYSIPTDSRIYVIEISKDIYCKVYVDGHIGYISKGFLKRKNN